MKKWALIGGICLIGTASFGVLRGVNKPWGLGWNADKTQYKLYNGWFLSPTGERTTLDGDMPGPIVFSPDGRYAIVATSGYNNHSISVIDWRSGKVTDSQVVARSSFGLCVRGNTVLSSGGRSMGKTSTPDIRKWRLEGDHLIADGEITLTDIPGSDRFVTSLTYGAKGLYVANAQSDEILRLNDEGVVEARVKVGYRPRMAVLSPDGSTLAVSEWGDSGVVLLDAETLTTRERFTTLAHPTALAYHSDGRLFVAESGSNTILQIQDHAVTRVTVSVDPTHPVGPTPTGLGLSQDGKQLFVTLAGENAVAVLDIQGPRPMVQGYIPTERWPASVTVSPDGKQLLVATAKGLYGPSEVAGKEVKFESSAKEQMRARVAVLDIPNSQQLKQLTEKVRRNLPEGQAATHLTADHIREANEHLKSIHHVIYVIKENKSYDQVLGDLKGANGDPSVTIFGEKITPNLHELARRFMIFDNLFCDGESSQVGHQWTDSAYASEYTESQWSSNYGEKGELDSDKRLTASPGDYIWSNARKHGVWARVYGEYVDVQEGHGSLESPVIRANPERWGYSEAWEKVFARGGRDTEKVETFLTELKGFEESGKMPSLMVMALPDDHTHGYSAGSYSPKAMLESNDLAVGKLVEAMSHSKFWKDTAIFVIQDDTQGALDHVESHRTYGYVISPWTQKGIVDSTHYTTASMLLTMEKILGLPPMSSYDAHATPMLRPFLGTQNYEAYKALPPGKEINDKNPRGTELGMRSQKLDWSDIDRADAAAVSRLLWAGEKPGMPYPKIAR